MKARLHLLALALWGAWTVCQAAAGGVPVAMRLHPDEPGVVTGGLRLLVGHGCEATTREVRQWTAPPLPADAAIVADTIDSPGELPAEPPAAARPVKVLDASAQVLVLAGLDGDVLWVRNAEGWSRPLPVGRPQPFWLGARRTRPGGTLLIGGRNLRREQADAWVVFRAGERRVAVVPFADARSGGRVKDPYLLQARLPTDWPSGPAEVWVHNRTGGVAGWVLAGTVEVTAPRAAPAVLNAADFGANGLDAAPDGAALTKGLAAAAARGGVLFLPPGTYQVETPLAVPAGVTLRGASRHNTTLEGVVGAGVDAPPLLTLASGARLERLAVRGCLGTAGEALVRLGDGEAGGPVREAAVVDCDLDAPGMPGGEVGGTSYRMALVAGPSEGLLLTANTLRGSVRLAGARRAQFVRNRLLRANAGGTALAFEGWDSLLDSNILSEKSGRLLLAPWGRNIIRGNELLEFRDDSALAGCDGGFELARLPARGGRAGVREAGPATLVLAEEIPVVVGDLVLVTAGPAMGTVRFVTAVRNGALGLDRDWEVLPDARSTVWVGPAYRQNVFYGNLNASFGPAIAWRGAVDCVVARHYAPDVNSGALPLVLPAAATPPAAPCWYNLWRDNRLDGGFLNPTPAGSNVPHFGNVLAGNELRRLQSLPGGEGPAGQVVAAGVPVGVGAAACTVVAGNGVSGCPLGVWIGPAATRTIMAGNAFGQVERPVLDAGQGTVTVTGPGGGAVP